MPRRIKIVEIPQRVTERRIRVVCGARSLEDNGWRDQSEVFIISQIGDFCPDDIVIDGGASGPDTWGHQIARDIGCKTIRFMPDGHMILPTGKVAQWRSEIREPVSWADFKERNWRMLDALQGTPGDTGVIALIDPLSPTKGAVATLNEAIRRTIQYKKWTAPYEDLCTCSKGTVDRRQNGVRVVHHES